MTFTSTATEAFAAPTEEAAASKRTRAFGAKRAPAPFDIGWSAGFVDGEACSHIARQRYRAKRSDTLRLRVYIVQNCREVLEHFRSGIDIKAKIYKVRRTQQHNKQVYTLNYEGKHALALIAKLLPHLIRKREEAMTGLAYWTEGLVGKRFGRNGVPPEIAAIRERFYLKMRNLK